MAYAVKGFFVNWDTLILCFKAPQIYHTKSLLNVHGFH